MILVVGANGFMGRNITERLVQDGIDYHGISPKCSSPFGVDLSCYYNTKAFFQKQCSIEYDTIIYCANSSNHSHACSMNTVYNNAKMLENLFYWVTPQRLIYLSSADVYSSIDLEWGADQSCYIDPKSYYGFSKLTCEWLLRKYHKNDLIKNLTVLRPCAMTGKYATHGLVKVICDKLLSDKATLNLIGPYPGTIKPFLFAGDLVNTIIGIIKNPQSKNLQILDIAGENSISVNEVAEIVMKELNIHKPIVWEGKPWSEDNIIVQIFSHQKQRSSEEAIKLGVQEYILKRSK